MHEGWMADYASLIRPTALRNPSRRSRPSAWDGWSESDTHHVSHGDGFREELNPSCELDRTRNQALSCEYFSKTSRLYSSLTALREICPFRSLAIFRRSGSVGACDFLLNLARNWPVGPGVFPNSRSNHPIVSSPVILRITTAYHREFRTLGSSTESMPSSPMGTDWQLRTNPTSNDRSGKADIGLSRRALPLNLRMFCYLLAQCFRDAFR